MNIQELINVNGIQSTLQTMASNQNVVVKFDPDCKVPCTDGKTIQLPVPNIYMSEEELTKWYHSAYHEMRHNRPETRDCFQVIKDNEVHMKSLLGITLNIVEDHRIEYNKYDEYQGERKQIAKSRQYLNTEMIDKGDKILELRTIRNAQKKDWPKGYDLEEEVTFYTRITALSIWDNYLREEWQPEVHGQSDQIYNNQNKDIQGYVDKLISGGYGDRMLQLPLISAQENLDLSKRILKEVFEVPEEEQNEEESSMSEEEVPASAEMNYKDLVLHDHSEPSGTSYTPTKIEYDSDADEGVGYTPYAQDQSQVVSMKGKNGRSSQYYSKIGDLPCTNISKQVRNLLQVMSKQRFRGGHKRGRLNSRALYRTQTGQDTVFKQKTLRRTTDTAVAVLCDFSGSMGGSKVVHASQAGILLSEAVSALNAPLELLGFTETWGGRDHLYHTVIKSFSERVSKDDLVERFSAATDTMGCNADGESIMWAYSRLITQRAKKKVMIVISDGQPAGGNTGGIYGYTKDVVRKIEQNSPVDIYAIGIEDDTVKNIYQNYSILKDSRDLEGTLLEIVKNKLIVQ